MVGFEVPGCVRIEAIQAGNAGQEEAQAARTLCARMTTATQPMRTMSMSCRCTPRTTMHFMGEGEAQGEKCDCVIGSVHAQDHDALYG